MGLYEHGMGGVADIWHGPRSQDLIDILIKDFGYNIPPGKQRGKGALGIAVYGCPDYRRDTRIHFICYGKPSTWLELPSSPVVIQGRQGKLLVEAKEKEAVLELYQRIT